MAAELGLLSLTQLQKLAQAQQQPNPSFTASPWMWNAKQQAQDDDDSWEVRAFAEDTGSIMGTTWPPRSYTCTFCRREFRSAQALGGHMNVHRRDRARLRQSPTAGSSDPSSSSNSSSTLIIPTREFVPNGAYCLLYPLPSPTNAFTPTSSVNGCMDSPSNLLSVSPYLTNNWVSSCPPSMNFPVAADIQVQASVCRSGRFGPPFYMRNEKEDDNNRNYDKELVAEEVDLELRLGQKPPPL
ncbi:PREDICTED: uncharacterized protein LOC104610368 [Nelumbo nucifera]|uniref:C2H2-type domain-containing protein n=2 Tax=Nelumbo nucifera TaxID=4432 RepID=A0A822X9I4_NELNU|nr:PREDICTED: uncharacterized protein LOC104610368 [Nelumbo nucifera]DAD18134.1 TPA_asm: hypothetical protein HUJ06_019597 [Nelumbo nucifera]